MSAETTPITAPRFAAALKDLSLASLHLKTLELRNALAHLAYSNLQLRPFAEGTQATLDTATSNNNHDDSNSSRQTQTQAEGQPDQDCIDAIRENELVMDRMRERILLIKTEVEFRGVSWREFDNGEMAADEEHAHEIVASATAPAATTITTAVQQEQGRESSRPLLNGVNGSAEAQHFPTRITAALSSSGRNPWTDGTFQTGTIRDGQLHMDEVSGQSFASTGGSAAVATTSSSITAPSAVSQQSQQTAPDSAPSAAEAEAEATATATATATTATGGGRLSDEELWRMLEDRLGALDSEEEEEQGLHL
ncbi:hypothetical protein BD289DRAFT_424034 [Coniella lustricola]|uniref:Secondary alcohol dehydrogenase n=1 Tax=Coniella lustricola TaxID=2025994 RepID=A0A2T3AIR9_9PEZI|nr:hypothetical protein BD289DRAFT_424034 [Coniella lustricola]